MYCLELTKVWPYMCKTKRGNQKLQQKLKLINPRRKSVWFPFWKRSYSKNLQLKKINWCQTAAGEHRRDSKHYTHGRHQAEIFKFYQECHPDVCRWILWSAWPWRFGYVSDYAPSISQQPCSERHNNIPFLQKQERRALRGKLKSPPKIIFCFLFSYVNLSLWSFFCALRGTKISHRCYGWGFQFRMCRTTEQWSRTASMFYTHCLEGPTPRKRNFLTG